MAVVFQRRQFIAYSVLLFVIIVIDNVHTFDYRFAERPNERPLDLSPENGFVNNLETIARLKTEHDIIANVILAIISVEGKRNTVHESELAHKLEFATENSGTFFLTIKHHSPWFYSTAFILGLRQTLDRVHNMCQRECLSAWLAYNKPHHRSLFQL